MIAGKCQRAGSLWTIRFWSSTSASCLHDKAMRQKWWLGWMVGFAWGIVAGVLATFLTIYIVGAINYG